MSTSQPRTSSDYLLAIMLYLRSAGMEETDRESTRFQVMASAIALFASKGYAGTSMREIAATVNIKAASLYSHWPRGKKQLLEESLRTIFVKFLRYVISDLNSEMSPGEQIEAVIRSHLSWQLTFGEPAMAWDMLVQQYGVINVLRGEALEDIHSSQQMYHGYLDALVEETSSVPERATDISIAVRTMCDQVATWLEPGGNIAEAHARVTERVWWLCQRLIAPRSE